MGLSTPATAGERVPAAELIRIAEPAIPAAPVQDSEGKAITFIGDERRIVRLLNGLPADWDDWSGAGAPIRGVRAYLAAALAYICVRYRATKVRQAPLIVTRETPNGEEWIRTHKANGILKKPNLDYGMRRMIEATETFLCLGGQCLWVKNRDRAGRILSMYPFGRDEFSVESDATRLYAKFTVRDVDVSPEDVVFFSYFSPTDPVGAVSPLDAALTHLNIGGQLAARVKAHVRNAMTPGAIYIADKDWTAGDKEFNRLKAELSDMFAGANSGKPMIAEGGGKLERGFSLEDLQLGELWREVEAVVCGCFGVPASLVGTVVGLENSPWSHLKTAKESFYDETVIPEWETLEEPITDSLLREFDDDPTHNVRFDRSQIPALQKDQLVQAQIATTIGDMASLNERRTIVGLEHSDEEGADDIPELTNRNAQPPAPPGANVDDTGNGAPAAADKSRRRFFSPSWKRFASLRHAYVADLAETHSASIEMIAARLLTNDAERIADIVRVELAGKSYRKETATVTSRDRERTLLAIDAYLDGESGDSWAAATTPALRNAGFAGISATVVPDLGIDAQLLRPSLDSFIRREAAFLVTNVTDTTKDDIRRVLSESLDAGEGISGTVKRIREATTFNRARATLVGRTETTRVLTGAPLESLQQYGRTTGESYTKSWLGTMDGVPPMRQEHWDMNGETVAINKPFSNGLQHPGEPNCRCGLTYGVEGVE